MLLLQNGISHATVSTWKYHYLKKENDMLMALQYLLNHSVRNKIMDI